MKILHTSDWHLGKSLYERKRYQEYAAFLDWLAELIRNEGVDVLLVSGDVFDTGTPSNKSQEIYYQFIKKVVAGGVCKHIVVTGGNHDSPSLLEITGSVLKLVNAHVLGSAREDVGDEVLVLTVGDEKLIVGAVPYLRDRDVRLSEAGESSDDKMRKLVDGVRAHYDSVLERMYALRDAEVCRIPLVLMGHLFVAGGQVVEGDGVRHFSVGTLSYVPGDVFLNKVDYVALGHLHVPQLVGGSESVCYSGSPIPIGFGEANQEKSVKIVSWENGSGNEWVQRIEKRVIPTFQRLKMIKGDWSQIKAALSQLILERESVWVEIHYEGDDSGGVRKQEAYALVENTGVEILRFGVKHQVAVLRAIEQKESLSDLNEMDVFDRLLERKVEDEAVRNDLRELYQEVLCSLHEEDKNAE